MMSLLILGHLFHVKKCELSKYILPTLALDIKELGAMDLEVWEYEMYEPGRIRRTEILHK